MLFGGKSLESVHEADLQRLIDNQVYERKTIEYKRNLQVIKESDKKEFLKDISSFANAEGGYLFYGIREGEGERKGFPEEICSLENISFDDEKRRLEQLIQDGINPRIWGVEIYPVQLSNSRIVIIIHIPKSWIGPHMVTFAGDNRFYSRNNSGRYILDVDELRALFLLSETAAEKAKRFLTERIGTIVAGETPMPISEGAKACLHVIPLASFDPRTKVDISTVGGAIYLPPLGSSRYDHSYTIDGYLAFCECAKQGVISTYALLFRNGIIETIDASVCLRVDHDNAVYYKPEIPADYLEGATMEVLSKYIQALKLINVPPPFFIALSFIGVKNHSISAGSRWALHPHTIERDIVTLPQAIIENFEVDIGKAMRNVFDALWNAGGYKGSPNYDAQGKWVKPW